MKHPQDLAGELCKRFPDKKLKAIKDFACCAFCLIWYLDLNPSDIEAIMLVSDLMDAGALDEECTVYWASAVKKLAKVDLKKLEKIEINTIKGIKEKTIVRYKKENIGHWVGVKNGKVVFNPLSNSVCVKEGKPSEKRVLTI